MRLGGLAINLGIAGKLALAIDQRRHNDANLAFGQHPGELPGGRDFRVETGHILRGVVGIREGDHLGERPALGFEQQALTVHLRQDIPADGIDVVGLGLGNLHLRGQFHRRFVARRSRRPFDDAEQFPQSGHARGLRRRRGLREFPHQVGIDAPDHLRRQVPLLGQGFGAGERFGNNRGDK